MTLESSRRKRKGTTRKVYGQCGSWVWGTEDQEQLYVKLGNTRNLFSTQSFFKKCNLVLPCLILSCEKQCPPISQLLERQLSARPSPATVSMPLWDVHALSPYTHHLTNIVCLQSKAHIGSRSLNACHHKKSKTSRSVLISYCFGTTDLQVLNKFPFPLQLSTLFHSALWNYHHHEPYYLGRS